MHPLPFSHMLVILTFVYLSVCLMISVLLGIKKKNNPDPDLFYSFLGLRLTCLPYSKFGKKSWKNYQPFFRWQFLYVTSNHCFRDNTNQNLYLFNVQQQLFRQVIFQIKKCRFPANGFDFWYTQFELLLRLSVTLLHDTWCWKDKTLEVEVKSSDVADVDFTQTGYILKCTISHEIKLVSSYSPKAVLNMEYQFQSTVEALFYGST